MNAIAALVVVVLLIVLCLFLAERLKRSMPRLLNKKPDDNRSLAIVDVIALDPKRRLMSVAVRSPSGREALAVIMTGGPSDVCVGWLDNEKSLHSSQSGTSVEDAVETFKKESPSHAD